MKIIRQLALTTVVFVALVLLGKPKRFGRVRDKLNAKIVDHESRLALNRCLYNAGIISKAEKRNGDLASHERVQKEIHKYLNI